MIATVGNGFVHISYDSGETWNQVNEVERENWNSVACDATWGNVAITSVSGILAVMELDGPNPLILTKGSNLEKWSTVTFNSAGTQVMVGSATGIILRSTDRLTSFSHRTSIQE